MKTLTKLSLTAVLAIGLVSAFGAAASAKDAHGHKSGSHHGSHHHHKHHDKDHKHASFHKHHKHDFYATAYSRYAKGSDFARVHRHRHHHRHRVGTVNFARLFPSSTILVFDTPVRPVSSLTLGPSPLSLDVMGLR